MAVEKPRIFQGGRDIGISLAIVGVLMVVVVGATGLCSFDPGRPEFGPVQEVDAETFMEMEARSSSFPVVYPDVPEGWVANSARRSQIAGQPAPVVGWFTAQEGFLQLTQTPAETIDAVDDYDDDFRPDEEAVTVAGEKMRRFSAPDDGVRDLWVLDLGETRALISGAASEEELGQLVTAVRQAQPIDTNAPMEK